MVFDPSNLGGIMGKITEMQKQFGLGPKSEEELRAQHEERASKEHEDTMGEDGKTVSITYDENCEIKSIKFSEGIDSDLQSPGTFSATKELVSDYMRILFKRAREHVDSLQDKEGGTPDIQKLVGSLMGNFLKK